MVRGGVPYAGYAVDPDGRLLIVQPGPEDAEPPYFQVVLNWFEELRQRVTVQ
jgi:hypothetical protein